MGPASNDEEKLRALKESLAELEETIAKPQPEVVKKALKTEAEKVREEISQCSAQKTGIQTMT